MLRPPRLAAFATALGLLACTGPTAWDAGADGGPTRDTGTDGGTRPDADRDGGNVTASDAGPDSGPRDPDWVPVNGLAGDCALEAARDPGEVDPLLFEPCPERDGCRQAIVPGVDPPFGPAPPFHLGRLHRYDSSAADADHLYFAWSLYAAEGAQWYLHHRVSRDDGVVLAALRQPVSSYPHACQVMDMATTPATFAAAVTYFSEDGRTDTAVVRARFDAEVESWAGLETRPTVARFAPVHVFTSDTTTVLDNGPSYRVGPDGNVTVLGAEGRPQDIDAIGGDHVYATRLTDEGWAVVRYGPAQVVAELMLAPSDGDEFALARWSSGMLSWERLRNPTSLYRFEVGELWIGRVDDDGEMTAPTHVGDLSMGRVQGSIGYDSGRIWVGEASGLAAVYDTETGERRELRRRDGFTLADPLMLGPRELGASVRYGTHYEGSATFEFIEYDALPLVPLPEE